MECIDETETIPNAMLEEAKNVLNELMSLYCMIQIQIFSRMIILILHQVDILDFQNLKKEK